MAYEKQTWVTGEVITKEKLNHMEDGIANSGTNVEVIKLGTISSMGGGPIGSGPLYNLQGTLNLVDGKTLGEIIRDKTIIATMFNIETVPTTSDVITENCHMVMCTDTRLDKAYKNKELLYYQNEPFIREQTSLSAFVIIMSSQNVNQSGLSASVYAMCI